MLLRIYCAYWRLWLHSDCPRFKTQDRNWHVTVCNCLWLLFSSPSLDANLYYHPGLVMLLFLFNCVRISYKVNMKSCQFPLNNDTIQKNIYSEKNSQAILPQQNRHAVLYSVIFHLLLVVLLGTGSWASHHELLELEVIDRCFIACLYPFQLIHYKHSWGKELSP